jgi:eukaryotic-like serine/threonine-protein kinase
VILHQLLSGDDPTDTPFLLAPLQGRGDPTFSQLIMLINQMTWLDTSYRPASAAVVKAELEQIATGQHEQRVLRALPPAPGAVRQFSSLSETLSLSGEQEHQLFVMQQPQAPRQGPANSSRRRLLISGTSLGLVLAGLGTWKLVSSLDEVTAVPATVLVTPQSGRTDARNLFSYQHAGAVESVSWSPDGRYIASASADKTVQIYDTLGSHILTYTGHTNAVTGVGWSPDGDQLVSTGLDSTVQVWDASSGTRLHLFFAQPRRTINLDGPIYGGVWSTEVPCIAIAVDSALNLIDTNLWQNLGGGVGAVVMASNALSWSPYDPVIAVAEEDHSIVTWAINSEIGGSRCAGHTRKVMAVDWSPDGNKLVSGSQDNTVRVWSIPPVDMSTTFSGTSLLIYQGHTDWVLTVAWSPDGRKIASAGRDQTVQIWDAVSGKLLFTYHGHSAAVNSLAWSQDGTLIASASDDKSVQIWKTSP